MKKAIVVGLACVNVALLAVLMFGSAPQPAKAQAGGFLQTDFLAIPCQVANDEDCLFVLDVAKEKIQAFRTSVTGHRVVFYNTRSLARDFQGDGKGGRP